MCETVAVGLSGGVDSLVTALMLKQQGYRVIGVYLQLWNNDSGEEVARLCRQLNIDFVTYDGEKVFRKEVVTPFVNEYLIGRTPNPCTFCNATVKWNLLVAAADSLGIQRVATGHYVHVEQKDTGWYIRKGRDSQKDQSYFLWGLKQNVLARSLTPLGACTKAEVKAYAESNGFSEVSRKKESMGICFLEGKDYREFIGRHVEESTIGGMGDIVDQAGHVIGRHAGLLNYTVGQKRDMPLRNGHPLYVKAIDVENNCIVAADKSDLYVDTLCVMRVNMVNWKDVGAQDISVKVRGLGLNPEGFAVLERQSENTISVRLQSPAWAVASGQPVAFYRGDYLIGGGINR
ncbi:tRNA 2-thiouridine(34) synthase MnmA [Odoribacter lunatus]|uniref:tRNA 2-thiouridine(34) synthase MnmA n=1 Tax=Odoribacter lunatus TaxID=2941335 RepID=UPI00203A7A79|nr:tRNA 2-thiouridine(34) synthase MnmA [Odoribacter lunatus]